MSDIREILKQMDTEDSIHENPRADHIDARNRLAYKALTSLRTVLGDDLLSQIAEGPDRVVVLPCKVDQQLLDQILKLCANDG